MVVEGNTITAAGSNVVIPDNAQIIDLGDATLSRIYGRAHHLTFDTQANYNGSASGCSMKISQLALEMIPCKRIGPASPVRDLGSDIQPHDFPDVSLRNAINKGILPAAHFRGDAWHWRDRRHFDHERISRHALAPNRVVRRYCGWPMLSEAVRLIKNGADVIKVAVSGGVLR